MFTLISVIITIILLIGSIIVLPTIKIKNIRIGSYWLIALLECILLIITKNVSINNILDSFTSNSSVNPIKILVLFISMTIISIFLDEIGFFKFVASYATRYLKGSQMKLFIGLYILISILTIFTSNDIIILTFTPFICYYAKNSKINPIPYLVSQFVAANTWSMLLIIGNPTNIYLSSALNIGFITYLKHMLLPTIAGALVSFSILLLIFRKTLNNSIEPFESKATLPNKFLLTIGLIVLLSTTIMLAISSYIGLEMWIISLVEALCLIIVSFIYLIIRKYKLNNVTETIRRAPWNLVPFMLSMFIIVLALNEQGLTKRLYNILYSHESIYTYGLSALVSANLINNIPMSVLFSNLIPMGSSSYAYAVVISSNIGAFITPIGALAGIMWMSLLKVYDIKYSFKSFMKYGLIIGLPTIIVSLSMLYI